MPASRAAGRRGPRPATPDYLERSALAYLARYATSSAHLRRILLAKVARSARIHGTDPEAGAASVDRLVARLGRLGLLDDAAYGEARALALFHRGLPVRAIGRQLAAKGLPADLVARSLEQIRRAAVEPDLAAALAYARRRRLGPFRPEGERAAYRARDLAALGRKGFDYDTARRVVAAGDPGELEDEAGSDPG